MKIEFGFGEKVDGYQISVLNEREIRAASGIMFLFALLSFLMIVFRKDLILAKYFVVIFILDFIVRVFVNPRYSPILIIGRIIVKNQTPEYVGAPQKKFAWKIGLTLSGTMFNLLNIFNSYSVITGLICLICLIFLFFDKAFGICLGCLFYRKFTKQEVKYCPGEVCEMKDRVPIQKVDQTQLLFVLVFIALLISLVFSFKSTYSEMPSNLWVKIGLKRE